MGHDGRSHAVAEYAIDGIHLLENEKKTGGSDGDSTVAARRALLSVSDVEQAVVHYERIFGFAEYIAGTPAEFAMVSRDGHCIMLRRVSGDISPNERQGGTWDAFFWVRDVNAHTTN